MVRVFIKGGVWKNSEDEILKAAIMKYGKQQWARVASLLNRKSAKQCKARWNEWLDPSVKKIEWTREEEEKLLHLAKLMPSQWRTIGSLLNGRSATQCQEHYERLLDEAVLENQKSEGSNKGSSSEASASVSVSDSLRRRHTLKPGDIDSHPETKPARPDPIDMDEDEIEMLQEARARLANTQGKKAKRKQREKILNEAKRLADLQKRRELKQAGLLSSSMKTRSRVRGGRREIDLGVEIPFHKPAPAGFHDVSVEREKTEHIRHNRLKKVNLRQINENIYQSRDREESMAKKKEENRLRSLERANAALAIHEVSKKNDPIAERKRGILKMPEPVVKDDELREVAKLMKQQNNNNEMMLPPPPRKPGVGHVSGPSVTDALLGDYSNRPLPTPMRTPMNQNNDTPASRVNSILREASQLRSIERGQTPLLSVMKQVDENIDEDHDLNDEASVKATPKLGQNQLPSATPLERSVINQTPSNLSIAPRDELGLNRDKNIPFLNNSNSHMYDDNVSVTSSAFFSTIGASAGPGGDGDGASTIATYRTGISKRSIKDIAREERRAAKRARMELENALKALPTPQFEYELAIPEVNEAGDHIDDDYVQDKNKNMVKDAADIEKEKLEQLRTEAQKKYEQQSTVLKRNDLPRPLAMNVHENDVQQYKEYSGYSNLELSPMNGTDESNVDSLKNASKLIAEEMMALVQYDAYANPPETSTEDNLNFIISTKKKNKKDKMKRKKNRPKPKSNPVITFISDEYLNSAKELLQKETEMMINEYKDKQRLLCIEENSETSMRPNDDYVMNILNSKNIQQSLAHAASNKMLLMASSNDAAAKWTIQKEEDSFNKEERLSSIKLQFDTLLTSINVLHKRGQKIKKKLEIKNGGYIKRAASLSQNILESFAQIQHSKIEEGIFSKMMENEEQEIWDRGVKLQKEIDHVEDLELNAQDEYQDALNERDYMWSIANENKDKKMVCSA